MFFAVYSAKSFQKPDHPRSGKGIQFKAQKHSEQSRFTHGPGVILLKNELPFTIKETWSFLNPDV
jgi:hypothetical protein